MEFTLNLLKLEKTTYFLIWILAVFYSLYCFTNTSYKYFENFDDDYGDFTKGYKFLSEKRDKADFEWEIIFHLIKHFYPWILFYIIISEFIRKLKINPTKVLQIWHIVFTLFYIEIQLGYIFVCSTLCFLSIFYIVCNISGSLIWLCTIISIFISAHFNTFVASPEFWKYAYINANEVYLINLSSCWLILKCTSYYLEEKRSWKMLDYLSYCLYPPTMFTGPFIPYKDFLPTYDLESFLSFTQRLKKILFNICRCLFWFLFGNICLHFVYVNCTSYQTQLVETFDSWSLYGYGYAMGQIFHIKYIVLYGLSTSVASYENVIVPHLPRCIGRIHLYSEMWKYFDPGLYKFLVSYIYIPSLKRKHYKLTASFLCFVFIYAWHGSEVYILIWTIFNYIGVTIEYASYSMYKRYENYFSKFLGPYWIRRIKCLFAAPLLAFSAISNFYFFAGTSIGTIFLYRIFEDNLFNNFVLLLVLYCCCQVCTELCSISAGKM